MLDEILENKLKKVFPFCTHRRHENIDVLNLSQAFNELPLWYRDNINNRILFRQTVATIQSLYFVQAGFDMSHEEIERPCEEAWKEKYGYLKTNRLFLEEKFVSVMKRKKKRKY